ncbi:MAG TPA: GGDEF domain-containing protein [Rheinheimera sp.]|nr:GGDEF domain-containing protein [Rheinheimera sp.]
MQITLSKDSKKQVERIDARRRHRILAFVSYITSAVMFFYGVKDLHVEQWILPTLLFATGGLFLLNMLVFHLSRNLDRACVIEAVLVGAFVLCLVYQGGFNNTALYWVFPFPAILFGLLGVRLALMCNTMLLVVLAVMLYTPDLILAQYKEAESSRFLASLVIVIIVCWINDHYRERSHKALDRLQQSKDQQANTDALTGLANRRFIDASLIPNFQQNPSQFLPLTLIMCDIDHFKRLNDRFGHDIGDEVLKAIAALFRKSLRQHDFACRIGGEEFLLILPQTSLDDASYVAEKIRAQMSQQQMVPQDQGYQVTASFGIAGCDDARQFQDSLKLADTMLYQAKHKGRDRVCTA